MHVRRLLARHVAAALVVGVSTVTATSCYGPTELTIEVSTNLPCNTVMPFRTAITVGAADSTSGPSAADTTSCQTVSSDVSRVGSLVVTPSGKRDGRIGVRVVLAVGGKSPEDCAGDLTNCIVATRSFSFIKHESRALPISLQRDCLGVVCLAPTTCEHGGCVSDDADRPCGGPGAIACPTDGGDGTDGSGGPTTDAQGEASDGGGGLDGAREDARAPCACAPDYCGCGQCDQYKVVCTKSPFACPLSCLGVCDLSKYACACDGDRCIAVPAPIDTTPCYRDLDCPPTQCCSVPGGEFRGQCVNCAPPR